MAVIAYTGRSVFCLLCCALLLSASGRLWADTVTPYPENLHPVPSNKTIRTELGRSPDELVRNVFAGGACDNISEIKGLGHPDGIGYFENGSAAIGLDRGIILATGPIAYAANSNSAGDKSGDFGDKTQDADLSQLATTTIRDRVGLEFDFVPLDSFVTFRYVFASEEYCEFVGSKYNDVFGFFVSGPGIAGGFTGNAANVALIPGSADFVSINNVNHKKNSQYYIDNTRNHDAERCGFPYTFSEREKYIEYDGFTVQLTAKLKLTPCETYHIRLLVADVADSFYDSAVFLEAGSFDLGGQVSLRAVVPPEGVLSEGCPDGFLEFRRDNPSIEFPLTIRFGVTDASTATEGEDFAALPPYITIPAGKRSVSLPIMLFNDDLEEGQEKIVVALDIPCACYAGSAEFIIVDPPELKLELDDLAICPQQQEHLKPRVSGGNPGYTYAWSNGATTDRLPIDQISPEPYFLTVTDRCGQQVSTSARVVATTPPSARISGMEQVCRGDTARLRIDFSGTAPWSFAHSVDGAVAAQHSNIRTNPYFLDATQAGDYELVAFSDAGCGGTVEGIGSVEIFDMAIQSEVRPVSCFGGQDGRIEVKVVQDFPPYSFSWEDLPEVTDRVRQGLVAGPYTVQITDGRACVQTLDVQVAEPSPLGLAPIDCATIRDGSWRPLATGGTAPYRYALDGKVVSEEALPNKLVPGNLYQIDIMDARSCTVSDTLLMPQLGEKAVSLPASVTVLLGAPYQLEPELHLPPALLAGIRWLPSDQLSCDDCLNPVLEAPTAGVYTIRTIDRFGCTDEASTEIVVNTDFPIYIPNVFSPNGDEINDRFGILAHSAVVDQIISLTIYNRWGDRVFQVTNVLPDDSRADWDGRTGGKKHPPGIYVYSVEIRLTNGEHRQLSGDVLLMR